MLEGKVRRLGGGLQDMLQINDKMPPGSLILPGASDAQWDDAKERWRKGEADYQERSKKRDK